MGKFRMYGRIVQLFHWRVDYNIDDDCFTDLFVTEEEADECVTRTLGIKSQIDTSEDGWFDGYEVPETTQPMNEAINIYNKGLSAIIREKRNQLLRESDWTQVPDAPFNVEEKEAIRLYRQQLRDIPQQEGFPDTYSFPQIPEILNGGN